MSLYHFSGSVVIIYFTLASSPVHVMHISNRIEDQKHRHRRNCQEIKQSVEDTGKFLKVILKLLQMHYLMFYVFVSLNLNCWFFLLFIRDHHCMIKTGMNKIITFGCIIAASIKTPATKQKKTVVTEQNCDSIPSFNSPIRTTSITRLYIVENIAASKSWKIKHILFI